MGCAEKIKMGNRSSCLNILLCLMVVMCFFSHTANAALKCKSGETFASADTLACLTCNPQCESACPKGSTVTKTNCNLIRFLAPPLCECCCKVPPPPPSPPPPSPPPPPPSPPPPSPPPPSPSPPPPSPPPPSPSPPPPSPPPPSPSPPPPSPPPPLICKAGEPYESFTCGPTTECTCCSNNCKIRCGRKNTTVETESCRKFTNPAGSPTVACQCCCKKPPPPPPPSPSPPPPSPSPPPPSPPPPPPSPPPPSPSPPPPSPPPPSPSPPSPSPPPPSPSPPPPPSPSPPPPPSCPEVCPSEFQFQLSPDQPPCTYKLASQIMIM